MSWTTYHRRKAAGLCALCGLVPPREGYVVCAPCRFTDARRKQPTLTAESWRVHEALRRHTPPETTPLALRRIPGPAVGHCGGFHAITTLPACCGTCGTVVLEVRA